MTTYENPTAEGGRTRTHTWRPRPEPTPEILGMSGLDVLTAALKGALPAASMMSTLGFRLTDVGRASPSSRATRATTC
ncbi:hypothetical protein ACGFYF_23720 [Streptomyces lavendulae]|uniref:hypothetical protein n=1 Tax=Streptomyces lavendulae TaxID=1914 RepID=UPI003712A04F